MIVLMVMVFKNGHVLICKSTVYKDYSKKCLCIWRHCNIFTYEIEGACNITLHCQLSSNNDIDYLYHIEDWDANFINLGVIKDLTSNVR